MLITFESLLIALLVINEIIKYPTNNVKIENIVYWGAFFNIEIPINKIINKDEIILIRGSSRSVERIFVFVVTIEINSELFALK